MTLKSASPLFVADGGIETDLIFNRGVVLPQFAAFVLHDTAAGRDCLRDYYRDYLPVAREANRPFLFCTATWRASNDWAESLGYDNGHLAQNNRDAVALCTDLADDFAAAGVATQIAGVIGPRRDAWQFDSAMTIHEAFDYHSPQIEAFAGTAATSIHTYTLTNTAEAIGIARASRRSGIPVILSFTVETDAETEGYPDFYMVNCAHPRHFAGPLLSGAAWLGRIGGLRANASTRSHAELDSSPTIDIGDIEGLGASHQPFTAALPNLQLLGGCCGTDHRHIGSICRHCLH